MTTPTADLEHLFSWQAASGSGLDHPGLVAGLRTGAGGQHQIAGHERAGTPAGWPDGEAERGVGLDPELGTGLLVDKLLGRLAAAGQQAEFGAGLGAAQYFRA